MAKNHIAQAHGKAGSLSGGAPKLKKAGKARMSGVARKGAAGKNAKYAHKGSAKLNLKFK